MPIRPEERKRYPKNWKEIVAHIRERAGDKCEWCGVPNHELIKRTPAGWEFALEGEGMKPEVVLIICTTAHLDHTPENCTDDNLAFLCQRCHNRYDAKHRAAGIKERRNAFTPELGL